MADTARTLAALITLLGDNSSGAISAQDLRDMLESLVPDHGEMYISSSSELTIAAKDTWYPEETATWTLENAHHFSMGTNGRLQYDGHETRIFIVVASISMTAGGNSKVFEWGIGVDGTVHSSTIIQRKIGTGADVGAAAVVGIIEMASGSYLGLEVRGTTDTTNVTNTKCSFNVVGMLT